MTHKPYNIIPALLTVLIVFITVSVNGQQSNTFYLMHDIPQSNLLNPAVQIECKWHIGIPALTSIHTNYSNTAFTYNDLAGTDQWNFEEVYNQMHRTDLYAVEANLNILSIGYRHEKNYFTFNISERTATNNTIPEELAGLALNGNSQYIGETANLGSLSASGIYFREYALGYSRVMSKRLTLGIHGKLLFGIANLTTRRSRLGLTTDDNSFDLHLAGDVILKSSFPMTISQDSDGNISDIAINEIDYVALLLNRQNEGFSIDIGAIYKYDERITLSASILDFGFIHWKTDLNNVHFEGSFDYTGAPPGTDFTSETYWTDLGDSLLDAFDQTVMQEAYYTWLPTQLFLGGTYQMNNKLHLGLTNRNVIFRKKLHSSFTASANYDITKWLLGVVSWSYMNNSIKNIGAGLALHGRGMQFHLVTDNLIGFLQPFDTRLLNLRVGFNLMFGCPKKKKEEKANVNVSSYPGGLPEGICGWAGSATSRNKYLKKASKRSKKNK